MSRFLIATRNQGAVDWVRKYYPQFRGCEVVKSANRNNTKGKIVVGNLPAYLISHICETGGEYWSIEFDRNPTKESWTADEMDAAGARLVQYCAYVVHREGKPNEASLQRVR